MASDISAVFAIIAADIDGFASAVEVVVPAAKVAVFGDRGGVAAVSEPVKREGAGVGTMAVGAAIGRV